MKTALVYISLLLQKCRIVSRIAFYRLLSGLPDMPRSHFSLSSLNTLGVDQSCEQLIIASTTESLISYAQQAYCDQRPFLILGGGSNIVLTDDFNGLVIKVDTHGIDITEDDEHYFLSVAAGEDWHQLVTLTVEQGLAGLENLALIPGTVGAAPIQNIGAYGVEFSKICDWVEYHDFDTQMLYRVSVEECQFGYRDSIFKGELKNKCVIVRVGLKLSKQWQPEISYGPLKGFNPQSVTAKDIYKRVCDIRNSKLPNPSEIGNVGSFFKNPVVSLAIYQALLERFPNIVAYPVIDGMKLAAGWLIDQAGLKGYKMGCTGVHHQQALVLVNHGGASGKDIIELASYVAEKVLHTFGVQLEVEPRLIGNNGEINFHG